MPKKWSRKVEKKPTEKQMELTLISLLGLTDRWEYPDFKEVYSKLYLMKEDRYIVREYNEFKDNPLFYFYTHNELRQPILARMKDWLKEF